MVERESSSAIRTALLRGREHTVLGGISTIAEGAAAIAISRGGAGKTYSHRDPNEDAAAFASSPWALALAVADGHGGHTASEVALERLVAEHAPSWLGPSAGTLAERWVAEAAEVLFDLNIAVLHAITPGAPGDGARTTLALVLARPGDDLLAVLSIGDSHVFGAGGDGVRELAPARGARVGFLGHAADDVDALRRKCRAQVGGLRDTRALVLATDGLSEPGIGVRDVDAAVAEAVAHGAHSDPELRPLEVARDLTQRALAAQRAQRSGDNVATAVAWLDSARAAAR